ncbi:hypothetical protein D9615_002185 [Tricholomella constricta]|uniref:cellulase n=1 Tax=Tricholomella constricta TaxID=117010 RepID=A0A8H5HMG7_9AGAR|nr:hypothetical protein D9615_002185 [Tricholomella constricta]
MFFSTVSKAFILLASACAVHAKILYAGVNESGGEFGVFAPVDTPGFGLPGRFGIDYAFINKSTVDIFVDQEKINFFRVTFLMERMCPLSFGLGSRFNETYFDEYADAINYITLTKGAYALIDPHNYMRYNDPSMQPFTGSVIGNTSDPTAATTKQFKAFWRELARRFVNNPKVMFGINNEPHDMLVLENNQAAIDGIRSVGARQLILAPGNGFTGGHSWTQRTGAAGDAPSSDFLNKLRDPLHNTAIDVHEYLDIDFSGGHDNCTQPGPSNLAALTTWLQDNHLKAVLSEFGGGNNQVCFQVRPMHEFHATLSAANLFRYMKFIDDMLKYLAANDVYIGWAIWAAGPQSSSNDARESTFAALTTPHQTKRFLVVLEMEQPWSCIGELSKRNKENLATGMANLTIKDDEGSGKLTGSKYNSTKQNRNNQRNTEPQLSAIDSLRNELLGHIKQLQGANAGQANDIKQQANDIKQLREANAGQANDIKQLRKANAGQANDIKQFREANAGQANDIKQLRKANAGQANDIKQLREANAGQGNDIKQLREANAEISTSVQRHTKTLYALQRRMVLDDARNNIATNYGFALDELRPRSSDLGPLMQQIRSRLTAEDSKLLSFEALRLIFDNTIGSMREAGNKAAHEATFADRTEAVLEVTLTNKQRALLRDIYFFTHHTEPDFETPA